MLENVRMFPIAEFLSIFFSELLLVYRLEFIAVQHSGTIKKPTAFMCVYIVAKNGSDI